MLCTQCLSRHLREQRIPSALIAHRGRAMTKDARCLECFPTDIEGRVAFDRVVEDGVSVWACRYCGEVVS